MEEAETKNGNITAAGCSTSTFPDLGCLELAYILRSTSLSSQTQQDKIIPPYFYRSFVFRSAVSFCVQCRSSWTAITTSRSIHNPPSVASVAQRLNHRFWNERSLPSLEAPKISWGRTVAAQSPIGYILLASLDWEAKEIGTWGVLAQPTSDSFENRWFSHPQICLEALV